MKFDLVTRSAAQLSIAPNTYSIRLKCILNYRCRHHRHRLFCNSGLAALLFLVKLILIYIFAPTHRLKMMQMKEYKEVPQDAPPAAPGGNATSPGEIKNTSGRRIHIQSYYYRYILYIARVCLCVWLWAFAKINKFIKSSIIIHSI